jgi:hypothetical protein
VAGGRDSSTSSSALTACMTMTAPARRGCRVPRLGGPIPSRWGPAQVFHSHRRPRHQPARHNARIRASPPARPRRPRRPDSAPTYGANRWRARVSEYVARGSRTRRDAERFVRPESASTGGSSAQNGSVGDVSPKRRRSGFDLKVLGRRTASSLVTSSWIQRETRSRSSSDEASSTSPVGVRWPSGDIRARCLRRGVSSFSMSSTSSAEPCGEDLR